MDKSKTIKLRAGGEVTVTLVEEKVVTVRTTTLTDEPGVVTLAPNEVGELIGALVGLAVADVFSPFVKAMEGMKNKGSD